MKAALAVTGISIAQSGLTAVWRHAGREHSAQLPFDDSGIDAAALTVALSTLRERVAAETGARRIAVHVALLPPFSEARVVRLPPLRAAEAQAVVARDAGRWFIGVAAPRVIAILPPKRAGGPVFAAAAAERTVDMIGEAAQHAGLALRSIVPAHAAWLAAAGSSHAVAAVHDDMVHLLQRTDGVCHTVRRFAAHDAPAAAAAAGSGNGRSALVLASGHESAARAFAAEGWHVSTGADAALTAARSAGATHCRFTGVSMLAERAQQSRRAARGFAAAALVLFVATAALHLWGAHRELNAIRGWRADIRNEVAPLLALRDSADRVAEYVSRIEAVAVAAPRWTDALFDIALLLPPESHLTRLFASGDTLTVDAEGERAGAALQALRSAATLRDARLLGAVDRELADGATTVERFRLRARLAPRPTQHIARAAAADTLVGR